MLQYLKDFEKNVLMDVACRMAAAAQTAPKASGQDKIVTAVVTGEEKERIVTRMHELAAAYEEAFIERDACLLQDCYLAVLIGVRGIPFGLDNCAMCGFPNCAAMAKAGANCALNITDLGIAIGSAVSIAADNRIDNRVMYSIGKALNQLDIFPEDVRVCYGIPLSISSKSVFFDREPGAVLR